MKTPSYLPLLLLCAALPAGASPKPGERCDTEWLVKTQATMAKSGGMVMDAVRIEAPDGIGKLVWKAPETCDAATWRLLGSGDPINWTSEQAGKQWVDGRVATQTGLLLVVDDFYRKVDPKAADVLAKADAVIEAAAKLGVVTTVESGKSLNDLLKGAVGAPFSGLKPKTVTVVASKDQKTNLAREELGPLLRLLLDDKGATEGGGAAVRAFRRAVLELNAEIGRQGASTATVEKRTGIPKPAVTDFIRVLPRGYAAPKLGKDAELDDTNFRDARKALTGAKPVTALDDASAREDALLDSVDLGVRNLIAIRAEQIEQIVKETKPRLGGKTITQLEVSARTAAESSKQPSNSLSAAVVKRLAESPEYMRLDSLYENQKNAPGGDEWVKRPEAEAMFSARQKILDAAKSAKVTTDAEGVKSVEFMQGGKKVTLTSVVPSAVENDADTRNDVAGMISRFILDGAHADAKYRAVLSAISTGEPGEAMDTGMTEEEAKVARTSPALEAVKKRAQGTNSLADLGRNDFERYAQRERARAAEKAVENQRARKAIETKRDADLAAEQARCKAETARIDAACKQELAGINAVKKDDFQSKESFDAERQEARDAAAARCAATKAELAGTCKANTDGIVAKAGVALAAHDEAVKSDNSKTVNDAADAALNESFKSAVVATVGTLRSEYSTAGSSRQKKLIRDGELSGPSPRLTIFIGFWFDQNWPPENADKQGAAALACAKSLGLGDTAAAPSFHNPENADTVAERCGVHAALVKYVKDAKGSIK